MTDAQGRDDERISEYTEQDRHNEGCCWDYPRQLCRGGGCLCDCHATAEQVLLSARATLRRQYDELQADNGRLLGRIKTLENDLEHALASVGAFRQAIENVFAKAEEHEIDQGGMIVTYVLPCGPLHRAIGLARGSDAGGKLLAERDDLAERLAAAEAANARAADQIMQDVLDLDPDDPEHPDTICISYDALVVVLDNALRGADAALAGSREQAGEGQIRFPTPANPPD